MSVKEHIVQRFFTVYGNPKTNDKAAFFAEYEKALNGTDPEILRLAADLVIKQHTFTNWPTIGECVEAVKTVAERRHADRERSSPQKTTYYNHKKPTEEEKTRVANLVKGAVANLGKVHKRLMDDAASVDLSQWHPTDRNAWSNRFGSSETTRWLSLSKEVRDDILGIGLKKKKGK